MLLTLDKKYTNIVNIERYYHILKGATVKQDGCPEFQLHI